MTDSLTGSRPGGALRARINMPLLWSLVLATLTALNANAQQREVQKHELESAEGRLMGFYSAAVSLSSLGVTFGGGDTPRWRTEFGLELGIVPRLTKEERTAGFDKPESSNISPVLPRPHASVMLPGRFIFSASWVPPVRVSDAKASILSAAIARPVLLAGVSLLPRISILSGRVEGAITCDSDLGSGNGDEQIYYANVCYANESRDRFEPRHYSFDVTFTNGPTLLSGSSYLFLGVRNESTRFDIGVIDENGTRDPDHPILEMEAWRTFGAVGIQWGGTQWMRYSLDLLYTPGSMLTARAFVGVRPW